ncbi:DoxX family protein [Myroides sp. C4067]|uniref:DoxX family protein n=1 Tax=Myroides sp. C4067 TaxID=3136765 RepID=UPI003101A3BC
MKAKFSLIVQYFFVLLFVYAAISKLITFEAFQVQLTQSPLLSAYATTIAYLVIIVELVIALFLTLKQTKTLGLYLSYGLMVAFTIYIYLILNYSDFIPCSCGGILEKMGWTEHLWFNIIVCILGLLAIYFQENDKENNKTNKNRFIISSILLTILSIGIVILLFLSSEHIIKKENPFIRKFASYALNYVNEYDLELNSYYLIGLQNDSIYLGNSTAPLFLGSLSTNLDTLVSSSLQLEDSEKTYYKTRLHIIDSLVYLTDGVVPFIYKGRLKSKKLERQSSKYYFSLSQPIAENSIIVRARSKSKGADVLGLIDLEKLSIDLNDSLLTKQIDGVFDTDGTLLYNQELNRVIYTYFYRNEYLVIKPTLTLEYTGKTIDTISKAQITISSLQQEKQMLTPPLTTNMGTATFGNYLLINSNLKGKNEAKINWRNTSVIDVYDLRDSSYQFSFVIPNRKNNKLVEFIFNDQYLFVVFDTYIRKYELNLDRFK